MGCQALFLSGDPRPVLASAGVDAALTGGAAQALEAHVLRPAARADDEGVAHHAIRPDADAVLIDEEGIGRRRADVDRAQRGLTRRGRHGHLALLPVGIGLDQQACRRRRRQGGQGKDRYAQAMGEETVQGSGLRSGVEGGRHRPPTVDRRRAGAARGTIRPAHERPTNRPSGKAIDEPATSGSHRAVRHAHRSPPAPAREAGSGSGRR